MTREERAEKITELMCPRYSWEDYLIGALFIGALLGCLLLGGLYVG